MATSLSRTMKKAAASSVIPFANRTTPPCRNFTSAIFTTPLKTTTTITASNSTTNLFGKKVLQTTSVPTHHHFSVLAENRSYTSDDTLVRVIASEINCAEEEFRQAVEARKEFPFKIVDIGKELRKLTLTREYKGEEIKVAVHNCHYLFSNWTGSISYKNGLALKFSATVASDGFTIDSVNVIKNPNAPDEDIPFKDMDENLHKALRTKKFKDWDVNSQKALPIYLEARGIGPSTLKTLYNECFYKYKHAIYVGWLNNLKNFIADK